MLKFDLTDSNKVFLNKFKVETLSPSVFHKSVWIFYYNSYYNILLEFIKSCMPGLE